MGRSDRIGASALVFFVLVSAGVPSVLPSAGAPGYPVLPIADDAHFLTNLSAPSLSPGGGGEIRLTLHDPLATPMTSVLLALEVYEFNAFPGNATSAPVRGSEPVFGGSGANGPRIVISVASMNPSETFRVPGNLSVPISTPSSAPAGTYAIRTSLSFASGSQSYLLESRGFFSSAAWQNATLLVNGTPILNASRLGVSGVIPETAVFVKGAPIAPWLYGLLAIALVLAAAGGYLAWRRYPQSRSGARGPEDPQRAPSAFGKRRTRDGD